MITPCTGTTTRINTCGRSTTTQRCSQPIPLRLAGYHRWDVYYNTTAGDVVLPIGYSATSPIPVADYLATHPQ